MRPKRTRQDKPDRGRPRRPTRVPPHRLRIIHEDADLIVIDKPCGVITASPEPTGPRTLFDAVKEHARTRRGRRSRVWVIHRLDRDASGLVIFALSEPAYHKLKDDLRARRLHRHYLALVEGERPAGETGTIQTMLRERRDGTVEAVPPTARQDEHTRPAVTHYRVDATANGLSLLRVRLETGRKHQIRAHLADHGLPIVGDQRYGAQTNPIRRLGLHALELRLQHPVTGASLVCTAPAPRGFYTAVGAAPPPASTTDTHAAPTASPGRSAQIDTSWNRVASWYDDYQKGPRSDHFTEVILPGAFGLLREQECTGSVLDLACGEGAFAAALASRGATVVGVDASAELVYAAEARRLPRARFVHADARELSGHAGDATEGPFDAVTCIMALMNIDPLAGVAAGAASRLKPGGAFVAVILHPSFRAPKRTAWEWTRQPKAIQYRRVDAYLSPSAEQIVMNPGEVAQGASPITTWTFHRPLEHYVRSFGEVGLVIEALEEWPSRRTSQPGPRAAAENRARREIPMFMGIRWTKPGRTS
ncbi:MAG: pseudouridine synthase [Phycisphaerales bacterium]